MRTRPIKALVTLMFAALVLASCGSDRESSSSTPTPEATEAVVATAAPTRSTEITTVATPVATTASEDMAATPVGSPVATPVTQSAVAGAPEAEAEIETVALNGALILEGREQQDYTLGTEGCVGLGEWRSLKPGAQVIVRDASGTVVDVATLEAIENGDACEWVFSIDAPTSDFFSVSIPMVTEVWFSQDDDEVQNGDIELVVP